MAFEWVRSPGADTPGSPWTRLARPKSVTWGWPSRSRAASPRSQGIRGSPPVLGTGPAPCARRRWRTGTRGQRLFQFCQPLHLPRQQHEQGQVLAVIRQTQALELLVLEVAERRRLTHERGPDLAPRVEPENLIAGLVLVEGVGPVALEING